MVKKIKKYLKFVVCCALIMSLIAPSYAALSASDGSAFVTKAEFDSALADFNARLSTFEAGINSKIDSQVSSYLDRNGIWNGKEVIILPEFQAGVFTFKRWKAHPESLYISNPLIFAQNDAKLVPTIESPLWVASPVFESVVVDSVEVTSNGAVTLCNSLPKSGLMNFFFEQRAVLSGPSVPSRWDTWSDTTETNILNGKRAWQATAKEGFEPWYYYKKNSLLGHNLNEYSQRDAYICYVSTYYGSASAFYPWEIACDCELLTVDASGNENVQFSNHQSIAGDDDALTSGRGETGSGPYVTKFLHQVPYQEYKFFFVSKGDKLVLRQDVAQYDIWGHYCEKNNLGLGVGIVSRLSQVSIY